MRTTQQLREVWGPPCQSKGDAFRAAYAALDAVLKRHNYRPKEGETWGYNCRKITGGSGYSLHAYGPGGSFTFWSGTRVTMALAVDINSLANPYGPRLVTDMPMAMVEEIEAIRTNGGHQVWGWGGRYARNKDAMHIEVVASPAELATGIASPERTAPAQSTIEEDDMHVTTTVEPGKELFWVIDGPGLTNDKRFTWLSVIARDGPVKARVVLGNQRRAQGGDITIGQDRFALLVERDDDKLYVGNPGPHQLGVSLVTSPR